jgi:hypothetical protein
VTGGTTVGYGTRAKRKSDTSACVFG